MEDYKNINNILKDVCDAKEASILNKTYRVKNLSMRTLAFILLEIGKVKKEDLDNNIYIATIPSGIAKKNNAVFAIELSDNILKVAASAAEGLIKQHTREGAVDEFERHLSQYIE